MISTPLTASPRGIFARCRVSGLGFMLSFILLTSNTIAICEITVETFRAVGGQSESCGDFYIGKESAEKFDAKIFSHAPLSMFNKNCTGSRE